jgi:hypothetical protein
MFFSHFHFYSGKVHDANGNLMFKIGVAKIGVASIKDASGVKIGSANLSSNSVRYCDRPIRLGTAADSIKYTFESKREKWGGMKIFAEIMQGSTVIGEVRGDLVGESVISLDGKVAAKVTYLGIWKREIEIVSGVDSAFVVMVVHALYSEYALRTNGMLLVLCAFINFINAIVVMAILLKRFG